VGLDKKVNLCHLISGDLWGGAEAQTYALLKALKHEDNLSISVAILNEDMLAQRLRESGFDVLVVDENKFGFWGILNQLEEHLDNRKFDILHTHRYKENILGALLKKRGYVKHLIQTIHGITEHFSGLNRFKMDLYTRLNRHFSKKYYDKIITVSYDIENKIKGKFNNNQILTIHNSIDVENIKIVKNSIQTRMDLDIEKDAIVFGVAGRMAPIKGYDIFLEAAANILKRLPHSVFVLAGDGPLKEELEKKAKSLEIAGRVRFTGFREDITDILKALDIFVISSYHEGIPIVLLEAMALGKPVIATRVGGIPEVIEDGISGILVASGDAEALSEACLNIARDPDKRKAISEQAPERIVKEFLLEQQVDRMLSAYQGLLKA
jgi:L-malate glycosyltransferase